MTRQELIECVSWDVRNALLGEVYASPKPGLVDRLNTGAHDDMNFETFQRSTEAITPYMTEMFLAGLDGVSVVQNQAAGFDPTLQYTEEETIFLSTRIIGMNAERAMFHATEGINTHKGMIFTMGIVLAAAGICFRKEGHMEALSVLKCTGQMTSRILENEFREMAKRPPVTHGEKLFHQRGEKGIRGQAVLGFPVLSETAIPVLRKLDLTTSFQDAETVLSECLMSEQKSPLREDILQEMETGKRIGLRPMEGPLYQNAAYAVVLLSIMCVLNDTNVLTRGTPELLEEVKERSREVLEKGALFTEEGYQAMLAFDDFCIQHHLSPGGAADLLAVAILLHRLEGIPATKISEKNGSDAG